MPSVLSLLCILLSLLSFNATILEAAEANKSEIDRHALLCFKSGINFDPLSILDSWSNESLSFCSWKGVTCGTNFPRLVVSLDLTSAQLSGQISGCLADLTSLSLINLGGNHLSGTIPRELGKLTNLHTLNLAGSNLEGNIPDSLGISNSLSYVNLANNTLTGGIPLSLANCSSLSTLILSHNNLSGEIPSTLFDNKSMLTMVDLRVNSFTGVIPPFHKVIALKFLGLTENFLSGSIPPSIGNVSSLTSILLSQNKLSGLIPETLGHITKLLELDLSFNSFSGNVPSSLYNMASLKYLSLGSNCLGGQMPSHIGYSLPNLQSLIMGSNKLEGLIPVSIANMSNLQMIDLSNNSLHGSVPSLGSLANLRRLVLGRNFLEARDWSFLTSLANCTRLTKLSLEGNVLNGSLPIAVVNLSTRLEDLSLGSNQILGSIPVEISNLCNLTSLRMESNLLSGSIPSTIGKLRYLYILSLSKNRLSGQIPSSVGDITQLGKLYLDSNGFSGTIPPSLGNCKQLDMLNLSFNSLEGPIPNELINSTSLVSLDLSNNNLAGSIPPQIGALLQLFQLDISFNNFSGQVPLSLGRCVQLFSLILRSNMLTGSIPQSFSDLGSIVEIDLSRNNLVGQIPEFLANMDFLQQLDLSTNFFEGPIPTGGIFQNHSAVILDGNAGLCASATTNLYQFPVCTTMSTVESKTNALLLVKLIPPIAIALLSFVFFMVILLKRRRQAQVGPCYNETMKKVSYGDIVKATNWFSPVNKISSSRTGSIYIGRFEFDTDLVVIKLFHLDENGARNSFLTECEVLRNTRHRNLVKAVTVCSTVDLENNEFKAIVFDFMANGSLDMWVHPKVHKNSPKRALSFSQRLKIAMDVALALDYMHNQLTPPLIHCDLKPGNVLLDYDMTARVGDFGSARFLSCTPGSPEDLVGVEGTIGYIAPEYGMGYKVSTGCDVYGFGVLLLEMLTGMRPTDAVFTDGLSLHRLVSSAFPGRLGEVLDPHMAHEQQHECDQVLEQRYIVPLVEVGLLCSMESPKDRPGMAEVCAKILPLKEAFFEFC